MKPPSVAAALYLIAVAAQAQLERCSMSAAGIDDVRLVSRCQITPVLAAPGDLAAAIKRTYHKPPA